GPSTPCKEDSCKDGSLCVNLLDDYVCLCSEGYYYKSSKCNKGELQRMNNGNVHLRPKGNRKLNDRKSFWNIKRRRKFGGDKGQPSRKKVSVFISVEPSGRGNGPIQICELVLEVWEGMGPFTLSVMTTMERGVFTSYRIPIVLLSMSLNYLCLSAQDRCDYYGCKKPNDQNDCDSGLLCECKEGLARPNPQIPMCVGKCSSASNGSPLSPFLLHSHKVHTFLLKPPCAFQSLRDVNFGFRSMGLEGALGKSWLKNKGRDVEEETLIEKDSQNLRLKETGFSNLGAEGSIFPKVRVNLPRDNESQNPY
ncbi:hypothetical protein MG293_000655, partial [Ovis ammon polii]